MLNTKNPRDLKISGGSALLDPYRVWEEVGLGAGMKIADFGCGAVGHFTIPAAKIVGEKGAVYAIDILKTVLEAIKSRAKLESAANVEYVWSNLEIFGATKIPEASLDFVLLANDLWQIPKNQIVFREAARLVKIGGKVVVVEWEMGQAPLGPPVEKRISKDYARNLAAQNNLREVKEFKAGSYHYGLIFIK